uniref:Lipocalin/cytosolic fatty-acid binding domain-containing protein n=1 Tax=Amblyomma maculatum TaxID=34609 RepID=G3MTL4_AMBMU
MKRFVIPLIMALGSADTLPKPSVDDLKAALNTYYIIWTVMRSFDLDSVYGKHSCLYALPISLASEDYRFYYGYNDGDWWKHQILYAKLQQEGENAVLVVSETQEGKGHPHTLQYWNSNQSCFILTFTNETSGKTELVKRGVIEHRSRHVAWRGLDRDESQVFRFP